MWMLPAARTTGFVSLPIPRGDCTLSRQTACQPRSSITAPLLAPPPWEPCASESGRLRISGSCPIERAITGSALFAAAPGSSYPPASTEASGAQGTWSRFHASDLTGPLANADRGRRTPGRGDEGRTRRRRRGGRRPLDGSLSSTASDTAVGRTSSSDGAPRVAAAEEGRAVGCRGIAVHNNGQGSGGGGDGGGSGNGRFVTLVAERGSPESSTPAEGAERVSSSGRDHSIGGGTTAPPDAEPRNGALRVEPVGSIFEPMVPGSEPDGSQGSLVERKTQGQVAAVETVTAVETATTAIAAATATTVSTTAAPPSSSGAVVDGTGQGGAMVEEPWYPRDALADACRKEPRLVDAIRGFVRANPGATVIYLSYAGSRLYGTSTAASDLDLKGIYIPGPPPDNPRGSAAATARPAQARHTSRHTPPPRAARSASDTPGSGGAGAIPAQVGSPRRLSPGSPGGKRLSVDLRPQTAAAWMGDDDWAFPASERYYYSSANSTKLNTEDDIDLELVSLDRFFVSLLRAEIAAIETLFSMQTSTAALVSDPQIVPLIAREHPSLVCSNPSAWLGYVSGHLSKFHKLSLQEAVARFALASSRTAERLGRSQDLVGGATREQGEGVRPEPEPRPELLERVSGSDAGGASSAATRGFQGVGVCDVAQDTGSGSGSGSGGVSNEAGVTPAPILAPGSTASLGVGQGQGQAFERDEAAEAREETGSDEEGGGDAQRQCQTPEETIERVEKRMGKVISHARRVMVEAGELLRTRRITLPLEEEHVRELQRLKVDRVLQRRVEAALKAEIRGLHKMARESPLPANPDRKRAISLRDEVLEFHEARGVVRRRKRRPQP